MASKTLTFSIRPRGKPLKKLPEELSLPSTSTSSDLYAQLAKSSKTSIHRLRITKGSDGSLIPNTTSLPVSDTGLRDGSSIYVKDLGPQLSWRLVFILEYLGPLLIHPILYLLLLPRHSSNNTTPSSLQTLSCILITLHFLKRELETLFLHRFSAATMPLFNLFKNSAHYWLLAGLNIAFWTYRDGAPAAGASNPWITWPSVALYTIGELGNLNAHLVLRSLRSAGGSERGIPHGLGFGLVTCPNYMFETLAWTGICGVTWSLASVLFAAVAVVQMALWAKKREVRYRRDFGGKYPRKRFVMLPGLW
ncbi:MAG: hypothetical protein L6R40_004979 [Gallowayella cf. fulva]|nr:MAG: hypothetical protein L6R40_004979 [Xanthomendoza cf. fulva]